MDQRALAGARRLSLVALLVLLATACRVDVEVGVDAAADGSGRVRVEVTADRAAAEAVDLSRGLRVDDLEQAGWEVEGPTPGADGAVVVVATKPFRDAAGAQLVVEEVGGAGGPFQGFRLQRTRSFARTTTRFEGTVDLGRGIEVFGDAGLRQVLGESELGLDLGALEEAAGRPLDETVGVQVAVRLPGQVEANDPGADGGEARWTIGLRQRAELSAESRTWNLANLAGVGGVGLAALGLLALFVTGRRR